MSPLSVVPSVAQLVFLLLSLSVSPQALYDADNEPLGVNVNDVGVTAMLPRTLTRTTTPKMGRRCRAPLHLCRDISLGQFRPPHPLTRPQSQDLSLRTRLRRCPMTTFRHIWTGTSHTRMSLRRSMWQSPRQNLLYWRYVVISFLDMLCLGLELIIHLPRTSSIDH